MAAPPTPPAKEPPPNSPPGSPPASPPASPPGHPPPEKPPAEPELNAERRIFRIIVEAPGIHAREIERRAGVGYGAVDYHLHRLEERGLVRSEPAEQRKAYFAADFPREERALATAIRAEPARRILTALLSFGTLQHGDLASVTGLGPSTVSHHAARLVRKGFVVAKDEGRRTFFSLASPDAVERALVRHGPSVGDAALDAYIAAWSEWRRPRRPPSPPSPPPPPSPASPPPPPPPPSSP